MTFLLHNIQTYNNHNNNTMSCSHTAASSVPLMSSAVKLGKALPFDESFCDDSLRTEEFLALSTDPDLLSIHMLLPATPNFATMCAMKW